MNKIKLSCNLRRFLRTNHPNHSYSHTLFVRVEFKCFTTLSQTPPGGNGGKSSTLGEISGSPSILKDRMKELEAENALDWPRIKRHKRAYTIRDFREKWKDLVAGEDADKSESICVRGKLIASRIMGTKLIFLDLQQDNKTLQALANLSSLNEISEQSFKRFYHLAQRGDYISVTGYAHRTRRGELSIVADTLPKILVPTLRSLPKNLVDQITKMRNRHVDLLLNRSLQQTMRMRSYIIQSLRNFLIEDNFLEVQTPILADETSGAIARPFVTTSEVISNKKIALRVAPELWLKRLIIGGFDRVFEIGPVFRNEGFDLTHNPEFTTCEFYKAFTSLEELIEMTENLFSNMARIAQYNQKNNLQDLPAIDSNLCKLPFRRIEFIPAIETAVEEKLPDLASDTAEEEMLAFFLRHKLSIMEKPTLSRLLDKLSSLYIEPQCSLPTFIVHHPACMAPLAKSFLDPQCNQIVSARAELFINYVELANMYEEENSPIEQRSKLEKQNNHRGFENENVDESYLSALEWGLPPTGGWGCGIDRLVMLFTGAKRIHDVLSFGSLKNVVNLRDQAKMKSIQGENLGKN